MASPASPISSVANAAQVTSNMMSMVPDDLFSVISADAPVDTPAEEPPAVDDTPATPAVEDAPAVEDSPEPVTEPPADDAAPDVTPAVEGEELPEGIIKTKDAAGKYKYSLDENRYNKVYGNHKMVQELRTVLGEEPTIEALKLRNDSYVAQQRMFASLESGDPAEQGAALNFIFEEMRAAHDAGEVGVDPTVPFAQTFYQNIREQSPDAYAEIRYLGARDLIGEMFETAAQTNNPQLFSAAQHVAMALSGVQAKPEGWTNAQYLQHISEVTEQAGIPFFSPDKMADLARGVDPITAKDQRIRELEQQLNGRSTNTVEDAYKAWHATHVADVNNSIESEGISPELTPIAAAWKDFPDDYKRLVLSPLKTEVQSVIRGDKVLSAKALVLQQKAARAASEQVRQDLGNQIKQLYVNRAKLAVEQVKGPILDTAAKTLKGLSDQAHARHAGAQGRTTPRGTSTPVRQSVAPATAAFKDGVFDSKTALRQMQDAVAALR